MPASLIEPGVEYNFTVYYINPALANFTSNHNTTPICPRGTFRKVGFGCIGECSVDFCDRCLDETTCIECASFAVLNTTTNTCIMSSTLSISGPSLASTCDDLELNAVIDLDEAAYAPITFVWTVASTSLNSTLIDALDEFLFVQSSSSVVIPSHLLEKGITYIFAVGYKNFVGQGLTSAHQVRTGSDLTPSIIVDGGETQTVKRNENITIKLIGGSSECFDVNLFKRSGSLWTVHFLKSRVLSLQIYPFC